MGVEYRVRLQRQHREDPSLRARHHGRRRPAAARTRKKNNGRKRSRARCISTGLHRRSEVVTAAVGHWAAGRKGCCGRPSTGDDESTIAPAGQGGIFHSCGPISILRILSGVRAETTRLWRRVIIVIIVRRSTGTLGFRNDATRKSARTQTETPDGRDDGSQGSDVTLATNTIPHCRAHGVVENRRAPVRRTADNDVLRRQPVAGSTSCAADRRAICCSNVAFSSSFPTNYVLLLLLYLDLIFD